MPRVLHVRLAWLLHALLLLPSHAFAAAVPVKLIFDTDMAEDVDDVGALALLHALADRGEVEILAVGISSRNETVGPCVDAINTWYGRPDLPIGYQRAFRLHPKDTGAATPSKYAEAVAKAFPHDLARSSDAPDAAQLYRRVLAAQPDRSVVLVSVGFLSNLRALLDTPGDERGPAGPELVARKVRSWVCMGGKFPDGRFSNGHGEYNLRMDAAAAARAIAEWPTPVVFSGFEIGAKVMTGKGLRGTAGEANPIRLAYRHFNGIEDRQSWDQTAVLYAARGAGAYWRESEPGACRLRLETATAYNEWVPAPDKRHRYLIEKLPAAELARVIEDLMRQAPARRPLRAR